MSYFILVEKNGSSRLNGGMIARMSKTYQTELKAHFGYSDVLEFDFEEEYFHSYKKFFNPSIFVIEGQSYCVYKVDDESELIKFNLFHYMG